MRDWFTARNLEFTAILAVLGYLALSPTLVDVPLCPTAYFAGLACPTCGVTRGLHLLLHGELAAAWAMNPIAFLAAFVLIRRLATLALPRQPLLVRLNSDRVNLAGLVLFLGLCGLRMASVV